MYNSTKITRKVLMKETSAPYWTIAHLTLSGRLPLKHVAKGKGDENIYHFQAIQILKDYLNRDMERLPIDKETTGAGRPVVYKPEAVQVVLAHIGKAPLQK